MIYPTPLIHTTVHLQNYILAIIIPYFTRSIINKLNEFQSLMYSKLYDIIGLTETWLSDTIYDAEILPYNYTIFCKDRPSCGGGVLLAVDNGIPCHQIDSPEDLEAVCINLASISPITVCVIYVLLTLIMVILSPFSQACKVLLKI